MWQYTVEDISLALQYGQIVGKLCLAIAGNPDLPAGSTAAQEYDKLSAQRRVLRAELDNRLPPSALEPLIEVVLFHTGKVIESAKPR
jgi:hypothetical protein